MRKRLIFAAAALALIAAAALASGAWWWNRTTAQLRATMRDAITTPADGAQELPAPVRRYLELAIEPGRAPVRAVMIRHEGEFRMGEAEDSWRPFTSTQFVTTLPPGFDWDARIQMLPGVPVFVRDGYVLGAGGLRAALFGLIPVMQAEGSGEIARGQLLRYLAESMWYPTALLPGHGVVWTPTGERSARATLRDRGVEAAVDFHFGGDGLVREVFAPDRPRAEGEAFVLAPWAGRGRRFERRDGLLIPMEAEVEWRLAGGPLPYWRGRITAIEFQ
jgi:hypothetical protein